MRVNPGLLYKGANDSRVAGEHADSGANRLAGTSPVAGMFGDFDAAHDFHNAVLRAHDYHAQTLRDHGQTLHQVGDKADTIGTSFATYTEPVTLPDRIDAPTVLSVFPHDLKPEPRSYAEAFVNLQEYVEHDAGGHFAAWEQPDAYAEDLRRAVKLGGQ